MAAPTDVPSSQSPGRPVGPTVITGASTGIGRALAERFALAEPDRPMVLVARREDRLQEVAGFLGGCHRAERRCLPLDLSVPDAADRLAAGLETLGLGPAHTLVNNAGFGDWGPVEEANAEGLAGMVDLNVRTLIACTHRVLPGMLRSGQGRILNVASTAAFQPGPWMAVYYATKAAVLSFSEGLHEEMRGRGVDVTALCPGPTRSEFFDRAGLDPARITASTGLPLMSAAKVAEVGYRALQRNRAVAIPGIRNRLLASGHRFLPRALVRRMVMRFQRARPSDG